jgi:alkaline phosphatase D
MQFVRALLLALLVASSPAIAAEPPSRILFGSCAHQNKPQPIWDTIVAAKPDLFLLIGDNIYGDTNDMALLREKYELFGAQPGFQKLLATCPLLATWDDHDYGINDGGAEFPLKKESQQVFLNFFGVEANSPRRQQEGVYSARMFGERARRLQVILLDTRYFRSALLLGEPEQLKGKKIRRIMPNTAPDASVLGEAQWQWLEQQLREPAEVRIIASSIQVLPEDHRFEKWANFPNERDRLLRLIKTTKAAGVLFISGDRHMAEISRLASDAAGYPIYDVTSSGLTHAGGGAAGEANRHRISGTNFQQLNFGGIEIDWKADDPVIRLAIFDLAGAAVQEHQLRLSQLQHQH